MMADQPRGEAAAYYNAQQAPNPSGQQQYAPPPQYGQPGPQAPAPGPGPNYTNGYGSEKPMFDQAFKLERPKYNDIWAGILVRSLNEAP